MRDAPRRTLEALGATACYGLVALLIHSRLLPVLADGVYAQEHLYNDCLLHVWTLAWDHHALVTDPRHLFDANIFFPHRSTLLYSDHLLGLAVLLAPLRLFTSNPVLLNNIATIAAPALNALAMYALARHLTGWRSASLIAGGVYGFAALYLNADRCQIQMLVAWWLPLILLFGHRAVTENRVRYGVMAGVALLLQGLTGIYLTAFFSVFLAAAHAGWLWSHPVSRSRRGWSALVGAEAAAVVILLPFLWEYRAVQEHLAISRSIVTNALFSLQIGDLPRHLPLITLGLLLTGGLLARRRLPVGFRGPSWLGLVIFVGALLLALGPVIALPGDLGGMPGPYRLLAWVPGWSALRAPGRMLHIALLGASLLTAGSFAALASRLSSRWIALACAATLAAVLVESWPGPAETLAAPSPPSIDAVHDWIAEQPDGFRYVELPERPGSVSTHLAQYASTWHWRPLLQGKSGLVPPVFTYMRSRLRRFPERETLADLAALGINHVVVHLDALTESRRARLEAALDRRASRPLLVERYSRDQTIVLALTPSVRPVERMPPGRALDRSRWRASATHGDATAALAIDGDRDTAWSSWKDLERAVELPFRAPIPFATLWDGFLDAQPATLTVDLGGVVPLSAVDLLVGGSDPEVYHSLRVETSVDGEGWHAFARIIEPLPDVRALVDSPELATFRLSRAQSRDARLLRLSCRLRECRVRDLQAYSRDPEAAENLD